MKKVYLLAAVAVIGLASCSKEELSSDNTIAGGTPLAISSASISAAITRASSSQEIKDNGAAMGVYQLGDGATYPGTVIREYDYSTTTTSWSAKSPPVYLNNVSCKIIGVYPYTSVNAATDPTSVSLTTQPYVLAQDLSYQLKSGLKNTAASVIFDAMHHAYSKLTFHIARDAKGSYTGTGLIQSIKISGVGVNVCGLNASGVIDLTKDDGTGTANLTGTPLASGASITATGSPLFATIPLYSATPTNYDSQSFLMVPSTLTDDVSLIFNVDGVDLSGSVAKSSLPVLSAGNEYTVDVTIQGAALKVTSVNVTDWATGNSTPIVVTPIAP